MKNAKMLSQLIQELTEIYNIEGDMPCVYATDDEGNDYGSLYFDPSVKYWDSFYGEVYSEDELESDEIGDAQKVVCIN